MKLRRRIARPQGQDYATLPLHQVIVPDEMGVQGSLCTKAIRS